ncbi:MAG: GUN4 domain-containing protein [Stigonema ocellatum SAG 48.90 = DSM 106950]|nr:GUN4 domain-containing protein [Stigonema ocellatum SAG 48.90 = DSM 106950]
MWKLGVAQSPIELTIQLRDSSSNLQREVPISTRRPNDDESQSVSALEYTRGNGADDDLSSDRAIDYIRLRDLLRAGNWKDADYETYLVMLKVVGRLDGDWIRDEELLNFPCTDLHTIDSLWVKYSNGRFGFSVQKKIYLCVGGVPDGRYYKEAWEKFGDRVGWRVKENWIYYEDVIFNTTAPYGHLPPGDGVDTEGRRRVWGAVWKSLLSHRDL